MADEDFIAAAERKAKQLFLKEEIIDGDYDPEVFTEYLEERKGADIDAWTFEELQQCVRDFKVMRREQEIQEKKAAKKAPPPAAAPPQRASVEYDSEEETKGPTQEYSQPGILDAVEKNLNDDSLEFDISEINPSDTKDSEIKGVLPPDTQIGSHVNVKAKLSAPEVVSGGLFSSSFVVYNIETIPLGWTVKRRYSDFLWLRQQLLTAYPGHYVPPLPEKKSSGRYKEDFVQNRQYFLGRFMNNVLQTPLFKKSTFLEIFLQQEDTPSFKSFQKQKTKKPVKLDEFYSLEGKLNIDTQCGSQEFITNLTSYLTKAEALKKTLRAQGVQLAEDLTRLSTSLMAISATFSELEQLQQLMPNSEATMEMNNANCVAFASWSRCAEEEKDFVTEFICKYNAYSAKEVNTFGDLVKLRNTHADALSKMETKVNGRKEKLWATGDHNKWELNSKDTSIDMQKIKSNKQFAFTKMLPKQTALLEKVRDFFGYYNYQLVHEVQRMTVDRQFIENKHFTQFADLWSKHITEMHMIWGGLKAKMAEVQFEMIPDCPHLK